MASSGLIESASGSPFLTCVIIILLHICLRSFYRLYLHPLSKFPGPKLAALTSFYAEYYDLPIHTSYVKKLPDLHKKYGPIIRAWPNMLHIQDIEAYHQVYKPGSKYEKDPYFYQNVSVEHSLFNIIDQKTAKSRKDLFQPYFSRNAIQRLEPLINEKICLFLDKIADQKSKTIDLTFGFPCLTADIVMYYCYQKTFGALEAPDFQFEAIMMIQDFFILAPFTWYFPKFFIILDRLTAKLPLGFLQKNAPAVAAVLWIRNQCRNRILELMNRKDQKTSSIPTVFDTMLDPDTNKGQFTPSERGLTDDALLMFVAGTDTTANTLAYATYHIINDHTIYQRLKTELKSAIQEKHSIPEWSTLENLPYLRGVVKEALRFGYGVPGKIPRKVPEAGAVLCGYHVPGGTAIAQSSYVYHNDPDLFNNPSHFNPERWIEGSEDYDKLERRLVSFSAGPRGCLGMNLAYAILYLTIAQLFRRFDLSIEKTTEEDMIWDDCFVPKSRGHLKIKAIEVEN